MTLAWLALPAAVVCGVWVLGNGDPPAAQGYPLAHTTYAVTSIILTGPLLAGLAVLAGGRWTAGGWPRLASARPPAVVAAGVLWPLLAAGACGLVVVGLAGVPGGRADLRVVGSAFALVAALTILGFGVGTRAPMAYAAPAVMVGGYLFFALPLIVEPLWLRQLTAMWSGCCAVDQDLDPRAVAAVLLVAAGLCGAGGLLGFTRRSPSFAVALAAVGVMGGAVLVAHGGPDPVAARDPGLLACADGLCLWPEHDAVRTRAAAAVGAVDRAGRQLRLSVPDVYSEAYPGAFGGLSADPRQDDAGLRLSTAASLIAEYSAQCAADLESSGAAAYPYEVLAVARGVLAVHGGLDLDQLADLGYDDAEIAAVRQLADQASIGRWLQQVQTDIRACQPHTLPIGSP